MSSRPDELRYVVFTFLTEIHKPSTSIRFKVSLNSSSCKAAILTQSEVNSRKLRISPAIGDETSDVFRRTSWGQSAIMEGSCTADPLRGAPLHRLKRRCGRSNLRQLNRETDATSARSRHCNAERLPMNHCSPRERGGRQRPAMTRSQETCL